VHLADLAVQQLFPLFVVQPRSCRKQRHLTYATVFRGDEYTSIRSVGACGRLKDRGFIAVL